MKTLGILGGMSPESTTTYYTDINRSINQRLGGNASAPLLLASVEFEQIVRLQKSGDWARAGRILADWARKLQQAGAEGILLATNTMHKIAPQIIGAIDVPFLHIVDAVSDGIKRHNLQQVALLGTRFTMSDGFYTDALAQRGIRALVPDDDTQAEIHRIIFEELCLGRILPQSKAFYLDTVETLRRQGAGGVILGCTEIGLLLGADDTDLPVFDTAQLHAQAAVDFILSA